MKRRLLFNLTFTAIFLGLFSLIISLFYQDVARALDQNEFFPTNKTFDLQACQQWRNEISSFDLTPKEKATEITILMYHRVIPEDKLEDNHFEQDGSIVSTIVLKEDFEEQMQLLHDNGYITLTLEELALFIKNELDIPKRSIVLTFDDGFKDNAIEVAPILREHHFHATSFVITGAVNKYDATYEPGEYQYFSVDDLHNICDVFEFESHTYNFHKRMEDHTPYLTGKPIEEVREDLEASIINLNGQNQAFASPYGAFNEENLALFKELGFNMAFTVVPDTVKPGTDIYQIPRKEIYPRETIEEFKVKIGLK
ncbi:polysaccharide deacetylase family protein [Gracilibacillus sp. S3-1-1]|uniref:Polysaccharide deacetylase family protein n=1 Tax=Gracilibacillus pellucidus TaxID=3095368 RepID=A0ACC6M3S4_9BACI|nr:polysaccharide deacetylase family protein [Gracilibacillus sp. S3-1-1]MDX8045609.1 polysaccharide deacetylase family protein [Gracilibacillus sp. S3-1-1]